MELVLETDRLRVRRLTETDAANLLALDTDPGTAHTKTTNWRTSEVRHMIKLKRAYEAVSRDDGLRILVERLWPRGVSKQKARIDLWLKAFAPSTELRQWYSHEPARWPQFRKRYWAELQDQDDTLALLKYLTQERTVTFVFAASDTERNSAVVLKEFLERKQK